MMEYIEKAAHYLQSRGISAGQRVALCAANCPGAAIAILACWKIGAVAVPISTRLPRERIPQLIKDMGCTALISAGEFKLPVCSVPVFTLDDITAPPGDRLSGVYFDKLQISPEQHASIVLTSASTGPPKGVLHTIANHYYSALGSHQQIPFGEGDGWLMSLPLYHIGGLSLLMRALLHGGSLMFPRAEQPLVAALVADSVTHVSFVPTQLRRCLADSQVVGALRRKKAILVGGAPCPTSLVATCAELELPVYLTYGCSEMASQVATATPAVAYAHPQSSGRVLPYRQVRIAADNEILVRGETLFAGYVTGDRIEPATDAQGWFHTADMGHFDALGNLVVEGRKDTLFISGGENIHPEEIENVVMGLAGVEQCVVVPVDDDEFGRRPVAFVKTDTWNAGTIKATLAQSLERFKVPDRIYAWPSDRPISSKIDRVGFTRLAAELRRDSNCPELGEDRLGNGR